MGDDGEAAGRMLPVSRASRAPLSVSVDGDVESVGEDSASVSG
ncbi:hypothetical protein [Hungatella hathewayi]|nr:hypothetical protein [Hungatella hathewayi]